MNDVLIVSAARLPIGRFGGALKDVSERLRLASSDARPAADGMSINRVEAERRSRWSRNLRIMK